MKTLKFLIDHESSGSRAEKMTLTSKLVISDSTIGCNYGKGQDSTIVLNAKAIKRILY